MATATGATITTDIPARLDRLPWSRWHRRILIGLGTVWILDGLEVTVIGSIAGSISAKGSGVNISAANVSGLAATMYIIGACLGSLLFGQLADRFGRKRLFMITLGVYLSGAILTAFAPSAAWFYACRFLTGAGIGGEYSAINSAIDELIPARIRGRIDIVINGTYWAGAAAGALLSVAALHIFSPFLQWRVCFALGFVLGLGILLVRRHVPESPRWLFIHGREQEAERVVSDIERQVAEETGEPLPEPTDEPITVRQRKAISILEVAHTVAVTYPKRTILGIALFLGQAALYNSILFGYATLLATFFHVPKGDAPYYLVAFAAGNLLGPLILSPLFDSLGRKPMIAGTYIVSGVLLLVTGYLFQQHDLTAATLTVAWTVVFFFASAGVCAAYLTVSEIFPMETRALCIAIFYSVGTFPSALATSIFGPAVGSGNATEVFRALAGGAFLMILGGVVEILFGVRAERRSLESLAPPLSAVDARAGPSVAPAGLPG